MPRHHSNYPGFVAALFMLASCSGAHDSDDGPSSAAASRKKAPDNSAGSAAEPPPASQREDAASGESIAPGKGMPPGPLGADESHDEAGRILEQCQGMKLVGTKYSPGGTTLPNKCAPFDVRSNNPYAIRCIDAMPDFRTPFPGDEYCILPPPPELGFQVGVHPGGNLEYWKKMWAGDYSFYEDEALTTPYQVPAGGEALQNYHAEFEGPSGDHYYYRRYFRGRYGSHHGTVTFVGSKVTESWQDNGDSISSRGSGSELITVQNAYTDIPQNAIDVSPEEKGIGVKLTPNSGLNFNLHHFNATNKPLLRENWINAWYIPNAEVTRPARGILASAPISYPVGMKTDNEGVIRVTGESQVLSLWGHRHAWTTRFHAWVKRSTGEQELVYDSNDWFDMPTFSYNSVAKNPEPGKGADGASSGPLVLEPGDELHFNCHAEVTEERAKALDVPMPTQTIEYANEALTGEMCLLLGQSTGAPLFGALPIGGGRR